MHKTTRQATSLAAVLSVLVLTASPAAQAVEGVGMRIVRDPVTGQLRGPTAEELQEMQAQEAKSNPSSGTAPAAPVEVRRADGSVKMVLDESQMTYAVVTRNANGVLTQQCVTGSAAAQKAVSGKKVSIAKSISKNAKEHAHDHE